MIKHLKICAFISVLLILLTTTTAVSWNEVSSYKTPNKSICKGVWINSINREGNVIASGFDFPIKYKNEIYEIPLKTYYKSFGKGKLNNKYNPNKNSKNQSTFDLKKLSNSDDFGIKAYNLRVWNQETRDYEYIDIKFTITNFVKAKNYKRKFGPYLSIYHKARPVLKLSGLENVTLKQEIFKHGTSKKLDIYSNTTYKDIDDMQGVKIVKGMNKSICYSNTLLKTNAKNNSFYNPNIGDTSSELKTTAFGISYNTSTLIMEYFDNSPLSGNVNDKYSHEKVWGDHAGESYFAASLATSILPKNTIPKITPYRKYNDEKVDNTFVQTPDMDVDLCCEFLDEDGDKLEVYYELYKGQNIIKKGEHKKVNSLYNYTIKSPVESGNYKIKWFAKDYEVKGAKTICKDYIFKIISFEFSDSLIYHTEPWDIKRHYFNNYYYGNTSNEVINYDDYIANIKRPRKRYKNVFWSGEKIMINLDAGPLNISSVTANLSTDNGKCVDSNGKSYSCDLHCSDDNMWKGYIWDESMIEKNAIDIPQKVHVNFIINTRQKIRKSKIVNGEKIYYYVYKVFTKTITEDIIFDDYRKYSEKHINY